MSQRRVQGMQGVQGVLGGLALVFAQSLSAQSCPAGPHALVLSGGAARGFAQLGALHVMDSLRARPDLVVGTSVGAIIGALYAAGNSAADIERIAARTNLASLFADPGPVAPRAFGGATPLLVWEQGRGGLSIFSSSRLEARLNARLNEALLAGNLAAGGDFSRLPVPLAIVAADLVTGEAVVIRDGDLVQMVRASMGIPLMFRPLRRDDRYLIDGGMADNVPVDPARAMGGRTLTIVDVTSPLSDSVDVHSMPAIAKHFLELMLSDTDDSIGPQDVRIRPDLEGFGPLDFRPDHLREAARRGAAAARAALPGAACVPRGARTPAVTGPFIVGDVRLHAAREGDRRLLRSAFGLRTGDTVDQARIRRALRAMERSPEPRELFFHPRREGDRIHFDVELSPSPARAGGLLLGYDHDYGARLGAMALDRSLAGGRAQVAVAATVSRFQQMARMSLRPEPVSWNPVLPALHVRFAHEAVRAYSDTGDAVTAFESSEIEAQLALEKVTRRWRFAAGPVVHAWDAGPAHATSAGFAASLARGSELRRPRLELAGTWTTDWSSAALEFEGEHNGGWWRGRLIARGTTTHDAPPLRQPALGGPNGFPGYGLFDLRGTDEAFGELSASATLIGPFHGRLAFAGGRSWNSHTDEWLGGLRLTVELPTPAGALRGGYGWASSGRGAVFVRLGAWF